MFKKKTEEPYKPRNWDEYLLLDLTDRLGIHDNDKAIVVYLDSCRFYIGKSNNFQKYYELQGRASFQVNGREPKYHYVSCTITTEEFAPYHYRNGSCVDFGYLRFDTLLSDSRKALEPIIRIVLRQDKEWNEMIGEAFLQCRASRGVEPTCSLKVKLGHFLGRKAEELWPEGKGWGDETAGNAGIAIEDLSVSYRVLRIPVAP